MRVEYAVTMNDVLLALSKHSLICFTLDNATNLQGKQVINMMACGLKPFFLQHFTMELRIKRVRWICWRSCWTISCAYSDWFTSRLLVSCYLGMSKCLMTTTLKRWSSMKKNRSAPRMNTSLIPQCFAFATICRASWSRLTTTQTLRNPPPSPL